MPVLRVLKDHNPDDNKTLRTPSAPVDMTDASRAEEMRLLFQDMLETMYHEQGIGIAAVQVGALVQALIVDVPVKSDDGIETRNPYFIINPSILRVSDKKIVLIEGCLSVRKADGVTFIRGDVERPESITIQYTDRDGNTQTLSFDGSKSEREKWESRCLQHEMAHLRGEVFTDYLVHPIDQSTIVGVTDVAHDVA